MVRTKALTKAPVVKDHKTQIDQLNQQTKHASNQRNKQRNKETNKQTHK